MAEQIDLHAIENLGIHSFTEPCLENTLLAFAHGKVHHFYELAITPRPILKGPRRIDPLAVIVRKHEEKSLVPADVKALLRRRADEEKSMGIAYVEKTSTLPYDLDHTLNIACAMYAISVEVYRLDQT